MTIEGYNPKGCSPEFKQKIRDALVLPFSEGDWIRHIDSDKWWKILEINGSNVLVRGVFWPEMKIGSDQLLDIDALKSEISKGTVEVEAE